MRKEMSLRVPREQESISMRGRGRVIVRREHSSGSSSGEEGRGRSGSSGRRQRRRSRSPRSRRRSQSRERRSSSRSLSRLETLKAKCHPVLTLQSQYFSSGSRRRRTHGGRTVWRSSRGGGEGRPEHRGGEGRLPYDRERERREQERRQRQQDTKRQVSGSVVLEQPDGNMSYQLFEALMARSCQQIQIRLLLSA